MRCGEPEIGVSDSAAEVRDGAAQEREKRGFAGSGERRLLRGGALCLRCGVHESRMPPLPQKGRVSLSRGPFLGWLSRAWARV